MLVKNFQQTHLVNQAYLTGHPIVNQPIEVSAKQNSFTLIVKKF